MATQPRLPKEAELKATSGCSDQGPNPFRICWTPIGSEESVRHFKVVGYAERIPCTGSGTHGPNGAWIKTSIVQLVGWRVLESSETPGAPPGPVEEATSVDEDGDWEGVDVHWYSPLVDLSQEEVPFHGIYLNKDGPDPPWNLSQTGVFMMNVVQRTAPVPEDQTLGEWNKLHIAPGGLLATDYDQDELINRMVARRRAARRFECEPFGVFKLPDGGWLDDWTCETDAFIQTRAARTSGGDSGPGTEAMPICLERMPNSLLHPERHRAAREECMAILRTLRDGWTEWCSRAADLAVARLYPRYRNEFKLEELNEEEFRAEVLSRGVTAITVTFNNARSRVYDTTGGPSARVDGNNELEDEPPVQPHPRVTDFELMVSGGSIFGGFGFSMNFAGTVEKGLKTAWLSC